MCSGTRRVCCSKMDDTRLEISSVHVYDSDHVYDSTETTTKFVSRGKPINEALKNINNLIHIRKSDTLGVALADWERSEQAYRKRVHRKKKVLRNTRTEVITLTGFFLALQGLLLTAAAISSSSQCTNLGFLLAVSGVVSFCALAFVCHKEVTMRRLQSVIVLEKAVQKVLFDILCASNAKEPLLEILCTADFLIAALL